MAFFEVSFLATILKECYSSSMVSSSPHTPRDNADRLRNVAFWHWEYMRRNPKYRRYCDVIEEYNDYFKSIGIFDYLESKKCYEELYGYFNDPNHDYHIKNNPFTLRMVEKHGEEFCKKYFKYGFLGLSYDKLFGRTYKHYSIGIDSEEILNKIFKGDYISFELTPLSDITALLKMHEDWLVKIDNNAPNHILVAYFENATIPLNPKASLEQISKIGHEAQVLNMIVKSFFENFAKQVLDDSTKEAAFQLSISGKRINNSDITRLLILWLWDQASKITPGNPEDSFSQAHSALKEKASKAGMTSKPWDQIYNKKGRLLESFRGTHECIQQMHVFNLNSK